MTTVRVPTIYHPSDRARRVLQLLAVGGAGLVAIGLGIAPERTWTNLLLAGYYLIGIGASALLLIAFASVSNAGWLTAIRRIPEALSLSVYAGGLWMLLLLLGTHSIYEWSHASAVASDPLLQKKSAWLNVPFFAVRTAAYVLLWSAFTWLMLRASRRQDTLGDPALTHRHRKLSGGYVVVFAATFWLASMDWIMSLEPHWYSTIFGLYAFSGSFVAGIAAVTAAVIFLRRRGVLGNLVRDEHLHDLGKLLFAFSTFWMYIWFSQYLLIWYANIPEETVYFIRRETAGWASMTVLSLAFNWVVPFVFLMSRNAKRNEGLLMKISLVVLIGHWIDLFVMIFPPLMPDTPVVGLWEIGPVALASATAFLLLTRGLNRGHMVPVNDPYLEESLSYHA